MTPQEQIELLQAQLAARDAQLATQSLRMAELQAQADAAAETLETRTRERDVARQNAADLTPPAGSVISRGEFKKRLAPAYLALADATERIQRRWDRILNGLLGDYFEVHLNDATVQGLIAQAVTDGLLTQQQAATVLAISL